MTMPAEGIRYSYAGNGATVAFAYPRPYASKSDVSVYLVNVTTGVAILQVINTDYSLTAAGVPSGGVVTFFSAPSALYTVVLVRTTSAVQGNAFGNVTAFPPKTVETSLDRLSMLAAEYKANIDRTLRLAPHDTSALGALPSQVDRASKLVGFDGSGNLALYSSGVDVGGTPIDPPLVDSFFTTAKSLGLLCDGSDETVAFNAIIAQINAGTLSGFIVFEPGTITRVNAALNPITGGNIYFVCINGSASIRRMRDDTKTDGKIFQFGDTTTRCAFWGFIGVDLWNENWRADTGTTWTVEARWATQGYLSRMNWYDASYKHGWQTYNGGSLYMNDCTWYMNKTLPQPSIYFAYAATVYLQNCFAQSRRRNMLSTTSGSVANSGAPTPFLEITTPIQTGGTYVFEFTVSNYVAGTLTPRLTGGTTVNGTGVNANGTYSQELVALSGNTTVGFQAGSTANMTVSGVKISKKCSPSWRAMKIGPEILGGNVDSMNIDAFPMNVGSDTDTSIVLEIDASYDDIGTITFRQWFAELTTSTAVVHIHSNNGSNGFVQRLRFLNCRMTADRSQAMNAIYIQNTNDVPMQVIVDDSTISMGSGAPGVKITGSAASTKTDIRFNRCDLVDRSLAATPKKACFEIGASGVKVDGCRYHRDLNTSVEPPTVVASSTDTFIKYTADVAKLWACNNDLTTLAATAPFDTAALTSYGTSRDHVIKNNWGFLDIDFPPKSMSAGDTTNQTGFATDTLLLGSVVALPTNSLKIGSRYRVRMHMTKTGAGVATPILTIRFGTTGTAADAAVAVLTFAAQTAVADEGWLEAELQIRSIGASAFMRAIGRLTHKLAATGFSTDSASFATNSTATSDTSIAAPKFSASLNAGASASWTITEVNTDLVSLN
jgi:hypothetical protein